jgi:hypothetical protein
MQNLNKIYTFLMCFILTLFSITCDTTDSNQQIFPISVLEQLESDVDNAILKSDGTVWTWESNMSGQLANGTLLPNDKPNKINYISNIITLDFCEGIATAVDKYGNIWFWGDRIIWEQTDPPIIEPVIISNINDIKQIQIKGVHINVLKKMVNCGKCIGTIILLQDIFYQHSLIVMLVLK